jgi:aminoglycoside phosphotransferase family enzyme/predicted kinase
MTAVEDRVTPSAAELAEALGGAEVRETHISWVFLTEDRAYKLKKPVHLPFVDYGTPARRLAMCEEEVRLNRRLAPDRYLGVRAVVPGECGVQLAPMPAPGAIDFVVEMRRFDESLTLAARVTHGGVEYPALTAIGRRIAEFHAAAPAREGHDSALMLRQALAENTDTLLALSPDRDFARRVVALARFTDAFLTARRDELDSRAAAGLVRDGHGDLRAEHVLLEHGVEILDCVEFDPALRVTDVGCDLAFLTMDLEALGSPFAAHAVLSAYRDAGGDPGDDALVAFFSVYRALVRAKVALVRAGQAVDRERRLAEARSRLALAERLAWRARNPGLIIVAGLSASGKSTIAEALASRSGTAKLGSDAIRKELLGIAPAARATASAYARSFNERTYCELARRARDELERTGSAIVDATFRNRGDRAAFLEELGGLPDRAVVVECRAPLTVRLERARQRGVETAAASDADAGVVCGQVDDGLLGDVAASHHVVLRTDREPEDVLDDLTAVLDARIALPHP